MRIFHDLIFSSGSICEITHKPCFKYKTHTKILNLRFQGVGQTTGVITRRKWAPVKAIMLTAAFVNCDSSMIKCTSQKK